MDPAPSIAFKVNTQELTGYAVSPKTDCPHLIDLPLDAQKILFIGSKVKSNFCSECKSQQENWVCLHCYEIYCSRYINGHMLQHNEKQKHILVFSFSDGSVWCFDCGEYVITKEILLLQREFGKIKFDTEKENIQDNKKLEKNGKDEENKEKEMKPKEKEEEEKEEEEKKLDVQQEAKEALKSAEQTEISKLTQEFGVLKLEPSKFPPLPPHQAELFKEIAKKKFKKIICLNGAGISVSAGIPDFRTPGTGLYSKLKDLKLKEPEDVFNLNFFKKNPLPFYQVSRSFLDYQAKPTTAHFFQRLLYDWKTIHHIFTQNIDGLEIAAGVPLSSITQAHGHMRTCHCISCGKEMNMKNMMKAITEFDIKKEIEAQENGKTEKSSVYYCQCGGLIKPDIVFFGEALPKEFLKSAEKIDMADLVIIMGTSLKVFPFAALVNIIKRSTPIVVFDRELPDLLSEYDFENLHWIKGDLDEGVERAIDAMGKRNEFEEIKKKIKEKN